MGKRRAGTATKKYIVLMVGIIFISILLLFSLLYFNYNKSDQILTPTLTIETPPKISLSETETFTLDVLISTLGNEIYPAASMCIYFDPSRLEFLGIKEGNVFVTNYDTDSHIKQKLPEWSCNIDKSNETGEINIMYLDMTGGRNSFKKELLAEDYNVVLRLSFRLRGSARIGDIYDITIEDAVFAASDESKSLATTKDSLKTKNAKIIIGE